MQFEILIRIDQPVADVRVFVESTRVRWIREVLCLRIASVRLSAFDI
jgi:hypothetical protein